jgi:hypothetical protein
MPKSVGFEEPPGVCSYGSNNAEWLEASTGQWTSPQAERIPSTEGGWANKKATRREVGEGKFAKTPYVAFLPSPPPYSAGCGVSSHISNFVRPECVL